MSRLKTWTIHAGIWILIAVISAGGMALWLWLHSFDAPTPPIAAGLTGNWSEQSLAFDKRVRTRYVIGASDQSLGADLAKQGFVRQDWSSSPAAEHWATFEKKGLCSELFNVWWRADEAGHLTSVRGEHLAPACP